jgi:hypothetical protein
MAKDDVGLRRVELFATLLLAFAAVATAWSTYQVTVLRGNQAVYTSRATAARIDSSQASTRAGQLGQIDVATFTQWVDAQAHGDTQLAAFYRQRFRKEFEPAFAAWLATHPLTNRAAPSTPFELPQYHLAEADHAERLDVRAGAQSNAAARANKHADEYMLAVVLFAACLFFAGISTKVESLRSRAALVALGGLIFVGAAVWISTRPVSFSL